MSVDLSRRGFVVENEWYWRISEDARTLDAQAAARDFLAPLARLAKDVIEITNVTADADSVRCVVAGEPVELSLAAGAHDRVAVNHLIGDINRLLVPSHHAFALVSPRRYELRGVLLTQDELAAIVGTPALLVPSGRPSWRAIPAPS